MEQPTQPAAQKPRRDRRGFALLIVLLLIIALTIVVWILQRAVAREVAVGTNVRDDLVAAYLASLGLVRGQAVLVLDEHLDYDSLNETWAQPLSWSNEKFGAEEGDDGSGQSERREPHLILTDEERKFNLLTLVRGTEAQKKAASEVLERLINICRRQDDRLGGNLDGDAKSVRRKDDESAGTDVLIRNLLKYLEERASEDSDDLEFTSDSKGKPDIRGMKKQTPYQMLTLGELLQVEGWTTELLYGRPRISQGQPAQDGQPTEERSWVELTDEEQFERSRDQIAELDTRSRDPEPLPLIHYLTLYSSGRVNINTCSRELLLALDERLTWLVVDQLITAREQDRRDVETAEQNGGTLPEDTAPVDPNATVEDKASFRPQDLATFAAFTARAKNELSIDGQPATLDDFTQPIYTAIRPWLVVRSTVFRVEASAKVGKITNTIYALFRRTGAAAATTPAPTTPVAPTDTGGSSTDMPLPKEPTAKLTLLFKDVKQD